MMRKLWPVALLCLALGGCGVFVDGQVKRSASIDYALVTTAVTEIDAGEKAADYAVDVLKQIEPSMKYRVDYFYGREPETEAGENGSQ